MSDNTEAFVVVGDSLIVGVDGEGVAKGGTVRLDPERTNIAALTSGGHVQPAAKQTKPAAEGKSGS
jgi:hypothetical protein